MNHRDHSEDIGRIEADIAQTRAEMDQTLSELQGRFTPGQLLDQGLAYLKQSGGNEFVSNLGATVKYNPMPVALAGIGIAWLMASGHRSPPPAGTSAAYGSGTGEGMTDGTRGVLQRASDAAHSMKAKVRGAMHSSRDSVASAGSDARDRLSGARERLSGATASARERAAHLGEGVRHGADSARRGFQTMLEEQPLLVGAIGLALGAALAAALPRTRAEDELMGETSDRLADQALRTGEAQIEKAGQAAQDMLDARGATPKASATATDAGGIAAQRAARGDGEGVTVTRVETESGWQERAVPSSQRLGDWPAGL